MTEPTVETPPPDPLDRLTSSLLGSGAVLSQIVAHMARFQAAGLSNPDAVPIPEAAHAVVKSAITGLGRRHSRRDLRLAARIISEAEKAIADEVFIVDPGWLEATLSDGDR
ncbi:MAG TPA: hypothetical protein VFN55_15775 [Solirubrobacteraceae bacterium]|nr:hypothetical protein [Solirubrobacteraceae bacterium]